MLGLRSKTANWGSSGVGFEVCKTDKGSFGVEIEEKASSLRWFCCELGVDFENFPYFAGGFGVGIEDSSFFYKVVLALGRGSQ